MDAAGSSFRLRFSVNEEVRISSSNFFRLCDRDDLRCDGGPSTATRRAKAPAEPGVAAALAGVGVETAAAGGAGVETGASAAGTVVA